MTVREQILTALQTAIMAAVDGGIPNVEVVAAARNATLDERMENGGDAWLNLLDGSSTSNGVCGGDWEFNHQARLMIGVRHGEDATGDPGFDAVIQAIVAALPEGGRLGGLADWVAVQPIESPDTDVLGLTIGFKVGELPIEILYSAPSSAG